MNSLLSDEQLLGAAEPPEGDCRADIRRAHHSGSDHIRGGSQSLSREGLHRQTFRRQLNSDGTALCLTVSTPCSIFVWVTSTFLDESAGNVHLV